MHRAPDLIVGLHDGYRVSWSSLAQISLGEPVVDNLSKLGGDHISVDHELVPGTLMANVRLNVGDSTPHILDVTPTVLDCFGLAAPTDLDGRSLWPH
jgi:predicted AlkP superfamily phosphohydrolase/phosphomutase